jgi:hypothetical protein
MDMYSMYMYVSVCLSVCLSVRPCVRWVRQPKREAAFKERLVLGSGKNAVRYLLVGQGVSPVFATSGLTDCSPLNTDGYIDIGDVCRG